MASSLEIFVQVEGGDAPLTCCNIPNEDVADVLYKEVAKLLGKNLTKGDPTDGVVLSKVAEVVVHPVTDAGRYTIKVAPVSKPEGGPKPPGKAGSRTIQSLIFARTRFKDAASAKKWLKDNGFDDNGLDETSTSYRARQFDPTYFEAATFRTIPITDGVSGVYGQIAAKEDTDSAAKADAAVGNWEAVRAVNEALCTRSLGIVPASADVAKADDGTEERFVLSMVLEPNDGKNGVPLEPDTQKDIYSADEIRKAAHRWMENGGAVDLAHSWRALSKGAVKVLESFIAPCDFTLGEGDKTTKIRKGSWLVGLRVLDEKLWKAVKDGTLGAFSIGGTGTRTPVVTPQETKKP
jgi:hypothetical protein